MVYIKEIDIIQFIIIIELLFFFFCRSKESSQLNPRSNIPIQRIANQPVPGNPVKKNDSGNPENNPSNDQLTRFLFMKFFSNIYKEDPNTWRLKTWFMLILESRCIQVVGVGVLIFRTLPNRQVNNKRLKCLQWGLEYLTSSVFGWSMVVWFYSQPFENWTSKATLA